MNTSERAEAAYRKYGDMLYRTACFHTGSIQDAEDAAAEVFFKYLTHAPLFLSENHEKAWLLRVLINKCTDLGRRNKLRQHLSLEDITHAAASDKNALELLDAVCRLPEKEKYAVQLHYFEDLSIKETAFILKISEAAVKMRLLRGREYLRGSLSESEWPDEL